MLSSATLNTESLERIKASLGIECEEVRVLAGGCDRPNIFQQRTKVPANHVLMLFNLQVLENENTLFLRNQ